MSSGNQQIIKPLVSVELLPVASPESLDLGESNIAAPPATLIPSDWLLRNMLIASDAEDSANFSRSVSLSSDGSILSIGAHNKDETVVDQGKVYIYDKSGSTWSQRSTVTASDYENGAGYGIASALSGNGTILAVGSHLKTVSTVVNAGKVYIYDWTGSAWNERGTITLPTPIFNTYFGVAVSLSYDGSILAVGAIGQEKVYIYDWTGSAWNERGIVTASDGIAGDNFGIGVSLSPDGSILAVGAYTQDSAALNAGKVYIYNWTGSAWNERENLVAPDATADDNFGVSVSLSYDGSILAVGAAFQDDATLNGGKVYIYDWTGSTWILRNTLVAVDSVSGDGYGISLDLSYNGNILVIGSSTRDETYMNQGKAYTYDAVY